jgi:hypothetical protein
MQEAFGHNEPGFKELFVGLQMQSGTLGRMALNQWTKKCRPLHSLPVDLLRLLERLLQRLGIVRVC